MTILDQIAQERQRISERLMRVDAERTKLGGQLGELETAERALTRFGGRGAAKQKASSGPATKTAAVAKAKPATRGRKPAPAASLGEATLRAVQAHTKGAKADDVLKYLSRKFGLTVRPNHLGSALQRHRRAGRIETRDQRWYPAPTA
jgi:hypothetical protein